MLYHRLQSQHDTILGTEHIIRVHLKLFTALALTLPAISFANQTTALQQLLDNWRAQYHLPGASLTIISAKHPNPLTLTSGVINLKNKRPVTANTYFQQDSITKVYTATLIFQLIAKHKLTLNQNLAQWLPQYPQWKQVTILQLLNMTSGIPSFSEEDKAFNQAWQAKPTKRWTTKETIDYIKNKPLQFKPGQGWHYSDIN